MKINLKLRAKLVLFTVLILGAASMFAWQYITSDLTKKSISDAKIVAQTTAQKYANEIEANLNTNQGMMRALANSMNDLITEDGDLKNEQQLDLLLNSFYKRNKNLLAAYYILELEAIRPSWPKTHGRYISLVQSQNGTLSSLKATLDTGNIANPTSYYYQTKQHPEEVLAEPYQDLLNDQLKGLLMSSQAAPLVLPSGKFAGIVASDLDLGNFAKLVKNIQPYPGAEAYLLSNEGTIVGHPDESKIGLSLSEIADNLPADIQLIDKISTGESFNYSIEDGATPYFITFVPITPAGTHKSWSLALKIPLSIFVSRAEALTKDASIMMMFGLVFLIVFMFILAHFVTSPIKQTTHALQQLADGEVDSIEKLNIKSRDEAQMMGESLNQLIDRLKEVSSFAKEIGNNNLEVTINPKSNKDSMGNALMGMKDSLQSAHIQEQERKKEEKQRSWANTGVARFSEITRDTSKGIEEMSQEVVAELVKYTEANQAGLFLLEEENRDHPVLELKACLAYDRKKFLEKEIMIGEGVAGRCFQEQETIYMTDLPQNYLEITSGLGAATPTNLLVVPLKVNDNIYGVLEIASFTKFEAYKIEFIERLCENFASVINTLRINQKTQYLLEEAQMQGEQLRAQEEEMRQNMEELQATQEDAARREEDLGQKVSEYKAQAEKAAAMVELLRTEMKSVQKNQSAHQQG